MYTLEELKSHVEKCRRCPLHESRNKVVFGDGREDADIFFIAEAPGYNEDQCGRTFVGKAGDLFEKAIRGIGMDRNDVYIGNVVKCHPPGNRNPSEDEMEACLPYLRYQVAIIKPKIIVCLGSVASKKIIGEHIRITADRGQWTEKNGIHIMPTFHPAALLRDESKKLPFWNDFLEIKSKLAELQSVEV